MRRALVRTVGCVLLLLACSMPARAEDARDPVSQEILAGLAAQDALLDQGKIDQVVDGARAAAISGTPDDLFLLGRALLLKAMEHRKEGRSRDFESVLGQARDTFLRAKEAGGLLYPPAHVGIARCARAMGDLATATEELRTALRIAPAYRTAALELTWVYRQQGLYADSESVIYKLLEERPDDVDARIVLGGLKSARKLWSDAEREFRAVVAAAPDNVHGRKLLATSLMFQQRYDEAAEHFETVRAQVPDDAETYLLLFRIYAQLHDAERVRKVLSELIVNLPGTPEAQRARNTLEKLDEDPHYLDGAAAPTLEEITAQLESSDPALVVQALRRLEDLVDGGQVRGIPGAVVRLISPESAPAEVRHHAVRLLGKVDYPGRFTLLEILLFHPKERDPDPRVRAEAAMALGAVDTPATVLFLYRALDDSDPAVREAAVQGLANRTGKWFRAELDVPTPADEWPDERARYERWWNGTLSGSATKRRAVQALLGFVRFYSEMPQARARLSTYALEVMADPNARTWSAGHDLFRALNHGLHREGPEGASTATVEDRAQITAEADHWLREQLKGGQK